MAVIHEATGYDIGDGLVDSITRNIWEWVIRHKDEEAFTVKVWFIRKTFRWGELELLLIKLLGPNPTSYTM
jgi:hypothetical protein